jgi:hypothetical protein
MTKVKNANGKLVCQVDSNRKSVEIVHKGFKTIVCFTDNGRVNIFNTKPANNC